MTTENDFERLYHLTYRDVSAYVIAKCRNPENAKDILQNTYIAFWKRLDRGKPIRTANAPPTSKPSRVMKRDGCSRRNRGETPYTTTAKRTSPTPAILPTR